jgi:hypothetical protein
MSSRHAWPTEMTGTSVGSYQPTGRRSLRGMCPGRSPANPAAKIRYPVFWSASPSFHPHSRMPTTFPARSLDRSMTICQRSAQIDAPFTE